jgi:hypothetical protein
MTSKKRFRRTMRHIRTHWPTFFILYGALVFALLMIGAALALRWYAFVPFSLAIMFVAAYFLISSLWVA